MKKYDIVSSALVALFGLSLLFYVVPVWVPVEAGPDFGLAATTMPNVAAVTVVGLSVLFFVYRLRRDDPEDPKEAAYDREVPIDRRNWLFLLRSAVFLIVMVALFEYFGFLVAGPPTIAGFMIMMGERRPIPIAVTGLAAPVLIWAFFWQFLRFPLP